MIAPTDTQRTSPSKRIGLLLAALLGALFAAIVLVLTVSQVAAAQEPETKSVEVKAEQAAQKGADAVWTKTGIVLPEGARVGIKAEGKVDLSDQYKAIEPDGVPLTDPVYQDASVVDNLVAKDLKVGALIGRIGESGKPFAVGESKWISSVTTPGELQLIVNDSYFPNNSGSFTAEITVYYPDKTPPKVIRTVPANGATGVARSANVKAIFSEHMKASTINTQTFKLYKWTAAGYYVRVSNVTVTPKLYDTKAVLNPYGTSTGLLRKSTWYKAVVTTGVEDRAGNALDQNPTVSGNQPKVWYFKTTSY